MDRQERLKMSNEVSEITVNVYLYRYASLFFDVLHLLVLPFTTDRAICDEKIFSVFNILFIRSVLSIKFNCSSSSLGIVKEFYLLFLLLMFSCCCCYCCCCCCCFRQILTIAVSQGVQA